MLADMQTERGLQAGREGQLATASLWFANAAALTPHDHDRQIANLRRAENWSIEAMTPVSLLKPGHDAQRIEFQPGEVAADDAATERPPHMGLAQ